MKRCKTKQNYVYEFPSYSLTFDQEGEPFIYSHNTQRYLQSKRGKNGYRQTTIFNINGQPLTVNFARFVMMLHDPQEDYSNLVVDHINRDKTDDRIQNLRWVTVNENAINRANPKRPHRGKPIIIEFDNGETIEYSFKNKDSLNIPYVTIYSLAIKKQGTHYSPKYGIKCYYKNEI